MKRAFPSFTGQVALGLTCLAAIAHPVASAAQGARSPGEIVATAPAESWVRIAPDDLLVMELAPTADGAPRRVLIQLIDPPFSQGWVDNIRMLARAHWYDGIAVVRVQDNYVVQWGDPNNGNPESTGAPKPLPPGLRVMGEGGYVDTAPAGETSGPAASELADNAPELPDSYADFATFVDGWPIAVSRDGESGIVNRWPVHCYGMVGVGRDLSPDTGTGAELYTVIGQAPRHLDRNIALVGRVVAGMEHLSSLPRGTGELGFYEIAAERVPIRSVRLASDVPATERPALEYLSTDSGAFGDYLAARANRKDAFFIRPAGAVDVCNAPVPVRRVPRGE